MKLPNVVKYLLIANIVVWILSEILTMRGIDVSPLCLFYVGSGKFMPHQVVTYMFMHAGFMHLFFNMFALFMFGRIMAMTWGEKKFLIYYLVCGVGAAITQEVGQLTGLLETNSCTLGASGAVFGILLAFGLTYQNERIFIIPIPFPIKAIYFVFFYIALEVIEFLSIKDGIAHLAHLGGMLFGWLLMLYWKHNKSKDINNWKQTKSHSSGSTSKNGNIFGWGTKQTTHSASSQYTSYSTTAGPSAPHQDAYADNARKKEAARVIDEILDKIRKDGWDSLSKEEQQKIIDASKEI